MYPPETPISAIFYPWKNRKFQIFKFFLSQQKNVSTCQWCKPEFFGLENLSKSLRKPFYEPHKNPDSIPHEPAKNCLSWDSNHSTRCWDSDVLTTSVLFSSYFKPFPCSSSCSSFTLSSVTFCSCSISYSFPAVLNLIVSVFVLKVPYCVFFFSDSRVYNGMSFLCYCSASY